MKNENEIFITHNDTDGKMFISLVQVYPTIKNITTQPINTIDASFQHKIIHCPQKRQVILVALNVSNQHTQITRYDDQDLREIFGRYTYFENATFMTNIYWADSYHLVIKDILGDRRILDMSTLNIEFMPGNQYPEIYMEPYWYSQPTNDTLYVHDKLGNKFLFDLGHEILFMGQSENHLIFISPEWSDPNHPNCKGATKCNTFWQFDKDHTNQIIGALHGRFNSNAIAKQLFLAN